MNALWSSSQ